MTPRTGMMRRVYYLDGRRLGKLLVRLFAALAALLLPATASAVDSIYWANRNALKIRFDDLDHYSARLIIPTRCAPSASNAGAL